MAKHACWAMALAKWAAHYPVKTIDEWCPNIRNSPDDGPSKDKGSDEENNSMIGAGKEARATQKDKWLPMVMDHVRSMATANAEYDVTDEQASV